MNIITGILLVAIALILLPAWVVLIPGIIFCLMIWLLWKSFSSVEQGAPFPRSSNESSPPRTIQEQSQAAAEDAVQRARKDLGF